MEIHPRLLMPVAGLNYWISFLIFSLYLLIAATTVTQRRLLLAEPLKLPVLNIDLPLWRFFSSSRRLRLQRTSECFEVQGLGTFAVAI
jgi:hypothetical protein